MHWCADETNQVVSFLGNIGSITTWCWLQTVAAFQWLRSKLA